MFGVFSNPKCLNMKNDILFESAWFADSLPPPHPKKTVLVREGVAFPDGDYPGTCPFPGPYSWVEAETKGWADTGEMSSLCSLQVDPKSFPPAPPRRRKLNKQSQKTINHWQRYLDLKQPLKRECATILSWEKEITWWNNYRQTQTWSLGFKRLVPRILCTEELRLLE